MLYILNEYKWFYIFCNKTWINVRWKRAKNGGLKTQTYIVLFVYLSSCLNKKLNEFIKFKWFIKRWAEFHSLSMPNCWMMYILNEFFTLYFSKIFYFLLVSIKRMSFISIYKFYILNKLNYFYLKMVNLIYLPGLKVCCGVFTGPIKFWSQFI